jgi:hypothetical protein
VTELLQKILQLLRRGKGLRRPAFQYMDSAPVGTIYLTIITAIAA